MLDSLTEYHKRRIEAAEMSLLRAIAGKRRRHIVHQSEN
jgi:hypothetical protein